ncbi:hypothetical protein BD410DRAFT_792223 [Rickenella mellea]|uniref:Uncharacterized protein n=1 Tax=Rickenella mellea TaxID=50990 RepID=A0A4Y7PVH6_9AGAM|nr:hypothetical protein BD410DRAFT_792223 [Rickenella mellea]
MRTHQRPLGRFAAIFCTFAAESRSSDTQEICFKRPPSEKHKVKQSGYSWYFWRHEMRVQASLYCPKKGVPSSFGLGACLNEDTLVL